MLVCQHNFGYMITTFLDEVAAVFLDFFIVEIRKAYTETTILSALIRYDELVFNLHRSIVFTHTVHKPT